MNTPLLDEYRPRICAGHKAEPTYMNDWCGCDKDERDGLDEPALETELARLRGELEGATRTLELERRTTTEAVPILEATITSLTAERDEAVARDRGWEAAFNHHCQLAGVTNPASVDDLEAGITHLRAIADAAREALGKIAANFDRAIELYEQHGGPIMLNEPIIEARHIARTTLHTIKEGEG